MKTWVSFLAMIVSGLGIAFYVGFGFLFTGDPVAQDHELEQINDKYVIHFSHVVAQNTPKGLAARRFAEKVFEKTNGWVDVQIYPNGMLYNAQEEFDALRQNDVQMIAPAFSEITLHDPAWYFWDLPYLFDDEDMVNEVFDGKIGELLFESIEQRGYKGVAYWDNGFKQMTTRDSFVVKPEDLANQTFRVMPSDVLKKTYESIGVNAVTYPFNEVYHRLKSGEVDGTENTLSNIYSKGFFQYQEYLTITNHNYLGYAVLMNPSFLKSLPDNHKQAVLEAMQETTEWLREHSYQLNELALQELISSNYIQIYEQTDEEKELWRNQFDEIYEEYEPLIGKKIISQLRR